MDPLSRKLRHHTYQNEFVTIVRILEIKVVDLIFFVTGKLIGRNILRPRCE